MAAVHCDPVHLLWLRHPAFLGAMRTASGHPVAYAVRQGMVTNDLQRVGLGPYGKSAVKSSDTSRNRLSSPRITSAGREVQ